MVVFNMPRGTGKTEYLIRQAKATGYPIIVATITRKRNLLDRLTDFNVDNVRVFTAKEYMNMPYYKRESRCIKTDGLLIDDLDVVLNYLFGADVKIATLTEV